MSNIEQESGVNWNLVVGAANTFTLVTVILAATVVWVWRRQRPQAMESGPVEGILRTATEEVKFLWVPWDSDSLFTALAHQIQGLPKERKKYIDAAMVRKMVCEELKARPQHMFGMQQETGLSVYDTTSIQPTSKVLVLAWFVGLLKGALLSLLLVAIGWASRHNYAEIREAIFSPFQRATSWFGPSSEPEEHPRTQDNKAQNTEPEAVAVEEERVVAESTVPLLAAGPSRVSKTEEQQVEEEDVFLTQSELVTVQAIPRNGDSQFASLAHQILRTAVGSPEHKDDTAAMRSLASKQLFAHKDAYWDMLVATVAEHGGLFEHLGSSEDQVEALLYSLQEPGFPAGYECVHAVADAAGVHVIVYVEMGEKMEAMSSEPLVVTAISIGQRVHKEKGGLAGLHYDSVLNVEPL